MVHASFDVTVGEGRGKVHGLGLKKNCGDMPCGMNGGGENGGRRWPLGGRSEIADPAPLRGGRLTAEPLPAAPCSCAMAPLPATEPALLRRVPPDASRSACARSFSRRFASLAARLSATCRSRSSFSFRRASLFASLSAAFRFASLAWASLCARRRSQPCVCGSYEDLGSSEVK